MSNEIVQAQGFLAPVVSVQDALNAYQAKKDLIDHIFVGPTKDNPTGVDFGVIPGSSKPTLLKAGAEKAAAFFGLHPRFSDAEVTEDWTGENHGGEPCFYYRRTCELFRGDALITRVDGSCNSWEKKYRYRSAERVCPSCGKSTIFKSKPRQGDAPNKPMGFYCWDKKGGCGETFGPGDKSITEQVLGQVKNPDIADVVNTILKMADKRALVAATLIATGLSEHFTQDIEDYVTGEVIETVVVEQPKVTKPAAPVAQPVTEQPKPEAPKQPASARPYDAETLRSKIEASAATYGMDKATVSDPQRKIMAAAIDGIFGDKLPTRRYELCYYLTGKSSTKEIPAEYVLAVLKWLGNGKPDHVSFEYQADEITRKEAHAAHAEALIATGQKQLNIIDAEYAADGLDPDDGQPFGAK